MFGLVFLVKGDCCSSLTNSGFGETSRPFTAHLRWPSFAGGGGSRFPLPATFHLARLLPTLQPAGPGTLAAPSRTAWTPRQRCLPRSLPARTSRLGQGLPPALPGGKSVFGKTHTQSFLPWCGVPGFWPPREGLVSKATPAGPRGETPGHAQSPLHREAHGAVSPLDLLVSP